MSAVKRVVRLIAIPLVAAGLAGCSPGGLSGSSTCTDFLQASADAQYQVVSTLAVAHHKPDYATPLGRPNIPYYCSQAPNMKLDTLFDKIS